ncbi:MAG: hypothetical protein OEV92_03480 [Nitrospinota bacterium]|nr:hypothetical protein [Nitrospinota bacterium]
MKQIQRYWLPVMMAVLLSVVAATHRDYGISWDEKAQSDYGQKALDYYSSGGADKSYLKMGNLKFYGPLFEMAAAMAYSADEGNKYPVRHLLSAMMGVLAVAGAAAVAGMINPGAGAFFAALCLAMTPVFYGHWFINSKDIPFAALFTWTMYFVARIARPGGGGWRMALVGGLVMGLTAAVRPAGAPLMLMMMILAGAYRLLAPWLAGQEGARESLVNVARPMAAQMAVMGGLSLGILAMAWPWAHEGWLNVAGGIWEAMRFKVAYPTLYDGMVVMSHQLPSTYILNYYLITAPLASLILSMTGAGFGVISIYRDPLSGQAHGLFLALAWFLAPVVFFMVAGANIYDGLRHFLFIMPAASILAGYGASRVMELAGPKRSVAAFVIMAAALALPMIQMARLHPYQYTYFNLLAGGVGGANGKYETEYWATSYKEAMETIARDAAGRKGEPVRILVAANNFSKECAQRFAGPNMAVETTWEKFGKLVPPPELSGGDLPEGYDYYLATYRYGMAEAFPNARTLFTIGREGALFTVIKIPGR